MRRLPGSALFAAFPLLLGGAILPLGTPDPVPPGDTDGARWALIIGISEYPALGEEGQLPGAVPDAMAMRDVLVGRWGFDPSNVRLLVDSEATREGIETAFTQWLPSVAGSEDQITIYFAGHGSQIWDETGETEDGLRQTIAPHDVLPDSPDRDIVDFQLGEWLRGLPTRNVTFILDSCHSGRITTREVTPFTRTRALPRSLERLERPPQAATRSLPDADEARGMELGQAGVLELAATQPHQVAVELLFPGHDGSEPFHGGAFTTYLVRQLWRAPADASYQQVFLQVKDAMKEGRFQQDPHLSEDNPARGAALFAVEGASDAPGSATLPVVEVTGNVVEIGAGAALGLTPGSVLESDEGARVVVEGVERGRTRGRLVSGSVEAGGRLALTAYRYRTAPLRANVAGLDAPTRDHLMQEMGGDESVAFLNGEDEVAHLYFRRSADEVRVVGLDGAIRHSFSTANGFTDELLGVLRKEAAANRLGSLENPAQPFRIQVNLADGQTSFGIGDVVTFHATSEQDGYLTLVDLGTDGTVTVLFPNPYDRDNRVRAGQEIVFPSPAMGSDIVAMPPTGLGTVRAFITERPLDLPTGEDFASGNVTLADEIIRAVAQLAGSHPDSPEAIRLEGWSTASVVYEIRP